MANVYLDAMIPRADFCEAMEGAGQSPKIATLGIESLVPESFLLPSLRKPDFQRETNQWTQSQVVTFIKSFLDNELIPSIIFWRAIQNVFVIDGAHRLSALIAWVNDDYGDGHLSKSFFGESITGEQKATAESVRRKINSEIGSFQAFRSHMRAQHPPSADRLFLARVNNARVRSLDLQWVDGDANKAETSFFKINQQGTALDETEERLLKLRRCPIAIAARSVIRAGTGYKYWSSFVGDKRQEIEGLSKEVHSLLFSPELRSPIKTLNIPHGGKTSPIAAYSLLMDMFAVISHGGVKADVSSPIYADDIDGSETIKLLKLAKKVLTRITGNDIASLGLHPAVYFYSSSGRHIDVFFLSFVGLIATAVRNNDSEFFSRFVRNRSKIESILISQKSLLGQANIAIRSKSRFEKWKDFFTSFSRDEFVNSDTLPERILEQLGLTGRLVASEITASDRKIANETKSMVFLRESLSSAIKCSGCHGLIDVDKSVSYDHIRPKSTGGKGNAQNVQLMHPYCNSLKGSD